MNLSGFSRSETVYARVALAGGFLTSVTDRFGLWGPVGSKNVAWGDMQHFLTYTAVLNPWFPGAVIPAVGTLVTALEIALAILLLVGFETCKAAKISAWLTPRFRDRYDSRDRSQVGIKRVSHRILGLRVAAR